MSAPHTRDSTGFDADEWELDASGTGLRRSATASGADGAPGPLVAATRSDMRGLLQKLSEMKALQEELDAAMQTANRDGEDSETARLKDELAAVQGMLEEARSHLAHEEQVGNEQE